MNRGRRVVAKRKPPTNRQAPHVCVLPLQYFLVLLTFSVLAIFVSTVVLTNLSDEATVVRGFAHHHWASVYSEALSNETKLTMGFNCEPDQTTGMTHAQSFTPCWEQAKPDLHMYDSFLVWLQFSVWQFGKRHQKKGGLGFFKHSACVDRHFIVIAGEILGGMAVLSVRCQTPDIIEMLQQWPIRVF